MLRLVALPPEIEDDSEPFRVAIPGSEMGAALKVASVLRRLLRRPPPAAVLQLRVSRRDEIRRNIGNEPEVLIINAKKWDKAGRPDNRLFGRGASDWFKAEVKDAADTGFEWFSGVDYVSIRRGKAFRIRHDSPAARKAVIVGRLRYERITFIDWAPDPFTSSPRFYVEYHWLRHVPYAETALYEESGDHLYEMDGIRYIGDRRLQRLAWRLRSAKYTIERRRRERRDRDERYGS